MFDSAYPYFNLGKEHPQAGVPKEKITYKFKAKHRIYLVFIEVHDSNIAAIKFCDRRDKGSKNAFTKTFKERDSDAIRVISTCINILAEYAQKNPLSSLAFLATQRSTETEVGNRFKGDTKKIEAYRRTRFLIYKDAMYNLFSPDYYIHNFDSTNCVYLLTNTQEAEPEKVKTAIVNLLSEHCTLLFDF